MAYMRADTVAVLAATVLIAAMNVAYAVLGFGSQVAIVVIPSLSRDRHDRAT
jgi:hypothetical protein